LIFLRKYYNLKKMNKFFKLNGNLNIVPKERKIIRLKEHRYQPINQLTKAKETQILVMPGLGV
jgi:hypothetical protein